MTVNGVDVGKISRRGWFGTDENIPAQIKTWEEIAKQRTAEANGTPIKYVYIVPEKDEITAENPNDIVETSEYYRTPRDQHKNADNLSMFSGGDSVYMFSAFANMDRFLTQPILIIAGMKANLIWQSELTYNKATAAQSREFYKIAAQRIWICTIENLLELSQEKFCELQEKISKMNETLGELFVNPVIKPKQCFDKIKLSALRLIPVLCLMLFYGFYKQSTRHALYRKYLQTY